MQPDFNYDNLQRLLRLNNIFAPDPGGPTSAPEIPTGTPSGNVNGAPSSGPVNNDVNDLNSMFKPDYSAMNSLSDLIGQMPQHTEKPGILRKIWAHAATMNANSPGEAQSIVQGIEEPNYIKAMKDWNTKLEPTEKLAGLQGQRNVNERTIANDVLGRRIQQQRADTADTKAKADIEKNKQELIIRQQRANAYEWRVQHPNHVIKEDSQGNLVGVNPADNKAEYILDGDGNPVKSINLTPEQKANLHVSTESALIEKRGEETRKTEGAKQGNRLTLEGVKSNNRTTLKQIPSPNNTANKPPTSGQQKTAQFMRAQQAINTHPEWKDYISLLPGQAFEVHVPQGSNGLFGLGAKSGGDPKVLEQINSFIYGLDSKSMATHGTDTTKSAPAAPKGWKYVPKAGGGWTAVEDK